MAKSTFEKAFEEVVAVEGGYSNHPSDPGGATRYGITEARARENGYEGDMRLLPLRRARSIYLEDYWRPLHLSTIEEIAGPKLAAEMFEAAVNVGVARVARWLQEWLNANNRGGTLYGEIAEDGMVGRQETIPALRKYIAHRGRRDGSAVLRRGIDADQAIQYKQLSRRREAFEDFLFGWMLHRTS
jgi:lysozyme family protein